MKFQAPGCSGQKKGYDILMCGSWQSVYPYPDAPWDWNMYLVNYHQFKPNVGKYSSPMEHVGSYLPNLLATYDHNHMLITPSTLRYRNLYWYHKVAVISRGP